GAEGRVEGACRKQATIVQRLQARPVAGPRRAGRGCAARLVLHGREHGSSLLVGFDLRSDVTSIRLGAHTERPSRVTRHVRWSPGGPTAPAVSSSIARGRPTGPDRLRPALVPAPRSYPSMRRLPANCARAAEKSRICPVPIDQARGGNAAGRRAG